MIDTYDENFFETRSLILAYYLRPEKNYNFCGLEADENGKLKYFVLDENREEYHYPHWIIIVDKQYIDPNLTVEIKIHNYR